MNGFPQNDDWLAALARCRDAGDPCALVTLVACEGSTPRAGGTKMLVHETGQTGSIGGGHLELKAVETARKMLAAREALPRLERFALGPSLGQCCGGAVTLLVEPFLAEPWHVWIFGAGHVGKALVHHLAGLPARVTLVDPRADALPAVLPANTRALHEPHVADAAADVPPGAMALVMTHSHDLDFALVERLLRRGDLAYVGLIGSHSKRARFEARLVARQVDPRALVCPIGDKSLNSKHPHAIAVSVVVQLMSLKSMREAVEV